MRFSTNLLLLVTCGCAAPTADDVCAEAAEIVGECEGTAPPDFGECTPEAAESAEAIVANGCDFDGKADISTVVCLGPLRRWLSWCHPREIVCEPSDADLDPNICNGSAELCDRRYDQVVYGTSHNAFSVATMGFIRPNQSHRMFEQLKDGMRALMLDGHFDDGETVLCHQTCSLGRRSFVEGLEEIKTFLECYPNEVVTLIIEPHTDGSRFVEAFREAGLERYTYTHLPGAEWPTLGEMLDAETRVVVFAEMPGEGTPDWYHHQWDMAFDTEYAVTRPGNFDCEVKRGDRANDLYGLNHFITIGGGDELLSILPNRRSNIIDHVEMCEGEFGRLPNFLAVDFHDTGSVMEAVDELNARPLPSP